MANILITTHWLDGDVLPFINIGSLLKKRGHYVTIFTHCHFKEKIEKAGLCFEAIDNEIEFEHMLKLMNRGDKSAQVIDEEEDLKLFVEGNDRRIREYRLLEKYIHKPDTILLSKTRSSVAAYLISEKYKIPLVNVFMNVIEPLSMINFQEMYGKKELDRLNLLRQELELPAVDSWLDWQASSKLTIGLWPSWYGEEEYDWPGKISRVGFFINKDAANQEELPKEVVDILDEKPILFTGSTTRRIRENYYKNVIESLAGINKKVIVVCAYPELLPEYIPDNVIVCKYINIPKLLPHICMIIHHGGAGSVAGALSNGIPQLILPGYIDQPFNGAICKKLGVSYTILHTKWNTETIVPAIEGILSGELDDKCCYYRDIMKQEDGLSKAADLIESIIGKEEYAYSYISKKVAKEDATPNISGLSAAQKALLLKRLKKK